MKLFKSLLAPTLTLLIIGTVVAAALSVTNYVTQGRIEAQKQQAIQQAMEALIPNASFTMFSQEEETGLALYQALQNQQTVGYIVCSSAMGYKSKVEVMTAFDTNLSVTGTVVTNCADESPGIGQKVGTDQAFLDQYKGYALGQSVDAITGATYSSDAVTAAVEQAIHHLKTYDFAGQNAGGVTQ